MNAEYKFTAINSDAERKKIMDFFQFLDLAVIFLAPDFSIVDFNGNAKQLYNWEKKDILQQSYLQWCAQNQITPLFTEKEIPSLQLGNPLLSIQRQSSDKQSSTSWDIICNLDSVSKVNGVFLIGKKIIPEKKILPYIKNNRFDGKRKQTVTRNILLEDLISEMPCFVFWKDTNFIYLGCNDLTLRSLNLPSREAIIGKTDYDFGWPKEAVDEFRRVDQRILATGESSCNVEETIFVKGKGEIVFLSNKMPIFNEYHEIIGIVGINIDITDRKRAEAALKEAKKVAEEANKAKSDFIGNMSHDIKTPLAGIIGIADCLTYLLKGKENIDFAESIVDSGRQLILFFDNCLNAMRIEHFAITAMKERFNLRTVFNEIIEMFKPAIKNKELATYLNYSPDAPEFFIGSREAVFRILMNLMGNAVKFTSTGSITLSATVEERNQLTDNPVKIKICIADTGIGIPESMYARIFERFVALQPSNKGAPATGSGLGLYLVKKSVEAMQGEVYVSSQEHQGSQFTVILPLKISSLFNEDEKKNYFLKQSKQAHPLNLMEVVSDTKEPLVRKTTSQLQLLLVEDNILAQKTTELILKTFNCEVDIADCGARALELFAAGKYHLVFMDLGLPDLSGLEVASHFRAIEKGSHHRVPIIALTAYLSDEIEKECLAVGMDKMLNKPLSFERTRDLVDLYAPSSSS